MYVCANAHVHVSMCVCESVCACVYKYRYPKRPERNSDPQELKLQSP